MIRTSCRWLGRLAARPLASLQRFDQENPASLHIPWRHFVTPSIFSLKQGGLGAVIHVRGIPFEVQDQAELDRYQATLSFVLQSLTDQYGITVTLHRHASPCQLGGTYPAGFAAEAARAYHSQFQEAQHYVNDIYLTLLQKPTQSEAIKHSLAWLKRFQVKPSPVDRQIVWEKRLRHFQTTLTNLLTALAPYAATLLGEAQPEGQLPVAEPLSLLSIVVNGEKQALTYPWQDIATFVPAKRLFMGEDTVHFQGLINGCDQYGALLSIKAYSPITKAGHLNALLTTPFSTITTHSFLPMAKGQALTLIDRQQRRLEATEDAALSQIAALEEAKDQVASGTLSYGLHHNTVLVLSDALADLDEHVAKVIHHYQNQHIQVVRETLNLESAFWAQIPGNARYSRRQAPISSANFSGFCSLHNYASGYIDQNHLGSALMLVETQSQTPFYFNLHERASGRKDDYPKGHTLLIGPSNAGKTVIMTSVDVMMQKYGIRSFFFDRHNGMEIYVRAMQGVYNRLDPGIPTGWNPCQLADTEANRTFLREFLKVLCTSPIHPLSARDINQISEVVERNYSLPGEKRNLSNMASFFTLDFTGNEALSRYLRLPSKTGRTGDRAYLFDNDTDDLNLDVTTMGFDMTHWLSDAGTPSDALLPISMYLFHRIEQSLDGRLTGLYLDEGWQFVNHPYYANKLGEWLVTWRKCNAFVFLATQIPEQLATSSLAPKLIQGAATHLFLANPQARTKIYREAFNLTGREIDIIQTIDPTSRYFLIKQGREAAIARLNWQGHRDVLAVLSANTDSVNVCQAAMMEAGTDDPTQWLPLFHQKRRT